MDESGTRQTANERLAALIAAGLRDAGLVGPERAAEVERKLAEGTARESDWRAWIGELLDEPGDGG